MELHNLTIKTRRKQIFMIESTCYTLIGTCRLPSRHVQFSYLWQGIATGCHFRIILNDQRDHNFTQSLTTNNQHFS